MHRQPCQDHWKYLFSSVTRHCHSHSVTHLLGHSWPLVVFGLAVFVDVWLPGKRYECGWVCAYTGVHACGSWFPCLFPAFDMSVELTPPSFQWCSGSKSAQIRVTSRLGCPQLLTHKQAESPWEDRHRDCLTLSIICPSKNQHYHSSASSFSPLFKQSLVGWEPKGGITGCQSVSSVGLSVSPSRGLPS